MSWGTSTQLDIIVTRSFPIGGQPSPGSLELSRLAPGPPVFSSSFDSCPTTSPSLIDIATGNRMLRPLWSSAAERYPSVSSQDSRNLPSGPAISSSLEPHELTSTSLEMFGQRLLGSLASRHGFSEAPTLTPSQQSRAETEELCAICLDDFHSEVKDIYTIADCKHKFHEECIRRWKKEEATCPLCRRPLPEDLGVTGEAHQFRPLDIFGFILNRLPLVSDNPVTGREKIANILLTPFGLAWVLLIIPLVLVLETLCLCLGLLVVLVMFIAEVCNDESLNHFCDLCTRLSVVIFLVLICVVLNTLVFIAHIPFLVYFAGTFCYNVFSCRGRWQDAFPYITRQIILGSYYFLLD